MNQDLTFAEASRRSGVSETALRRAAQRGRLVVKRDPRNGRVYIAAAALSAYLAGKP